MRITRFDIIQYYFCNHLTLVRKSTTTNNSLYVWHKKPMTTVLWLLPGLLQWNIDNTPFIICAEYRNMLPWTYQVFQKATKRPSTDGQVYLRSLLGRSYFQMEYRFKTFYFQHDIMAPRLPCPLGITLHNRFLLGSDTLHLWSLLDFPQWQQCCWVCFFHSYLFQRRGKVQFLERKPFDLEWNLIEICYLGSTWRNAILLITWGWGGGWPITIWWYNVVILLLYRVSIQ